MSANLAFAMLLAATVMLLLLPFVPGFLVLWRRQDATPLRVVSSDEVDARYFARRFREHIRTRLEPRMKSAGPATTGRPGEPGAWTPDKLITGENALILSRQELHAGEVDRMLVSAVDLRLPGDLIMRHEVFAERSVHGGDRNIYRAILADGDIVLGVETMLLRWMHAAGNVRVGSGARLHGRVTSDKLIRLEAGCRFERLHAPRIEFGEPADVKRVAKALTPLDSSEVPHLADVTGRRWLIDHRSEIPSGRVIDADLVFTGPARIGAGTRILGSIKGHKDVYLGEGVQVTGSVVSIHDIHIGAGCDIHGPVLSEKSVRVGKGAVIGDPRTPTTVSARNIHVSPGAVAHGTVWSRAIGMVNGGLGA